MNIYLVDFENVKNNGLLGADRLGREDKLFIFYSENADKITFEVHEMLCRIPAQVVFFKVTVGVKNALDLQLASYLGKLIQQYPGARFYLVTSDKVFAHLQNFWNQVSIDILESISYGPEKTVPEKEELFDPPEKALNSQTSEMTNWPQKWEDTTLMQEDATQLPGKADNTERLVATDTTAKPVKTQRTNKPKKQNKPERTEKPEKAQKLEQDEKPEKTQKPERVEKPEKTQKPERAEKLEKAQKPERAEKPEKEQKQTSSEKLELLEKIRERLPEDSGMWDEICDSILKFKTKQAINNALVKKFGSTEGGKMYQKIKPVLKNKK